MRNVHKLTTCEVQKDITIRLRFEGGGWATMSFQYFRENDWWQVSINSDWGNWAYSWSRSGMGMDIFNFMAREGRSGYLVGKFTSQEPDIFNASKSAKLVRKDIRNELNYWDDREKFQYLIDFTKELESEDNIDYFVNSLYEEEQMQEVLGDEYRCYWNYVVMETHPRTKYFFKNIFPKFFKEIKRLAREQQA